MQDNLSMVITMIIFVTLVVIFPLYNLFERQDDMSYTLALKATTSFVDKIRNNGYIDQKSYDSYISELGNTGNSYDIIIEAHRKTLIVDETKTDEYLEQYRIDYTEDILKVINSGISNISGQVVKESAYLLNQDDQIYVKLKNSSVTMAGAIFNAIVPTSKQDRIVVNYGGVIKNSSWDRVEVTAQTFGNSPTMPNVTATLPIVGTTITTTSGTSITFTASSIVGDSWKTIQSYVWSISYGNSTTETDIITLAVGGASPNFTANMTRVFNQGTPNLVRVYAVDNEGVISEVRTITVIAN